MNTKEMTGEQLFLFYLGQYDDYSNTLGQAALMMEENELFKILERAEKENKEIEISEKPGYEGVMDPPLQVKLIPKKQ